MNAHIVAARRALGLIALASASVLALASAASAQTAAPAAPDPGVAQDRPAAPPAAAPPADTGEIVVTAQRREQRLSNVGLSITAIGGEALRTRNFTTPDDLAKLVPGLSVSDTGYSTPVYTLRGVGVNEQSAGSNSSVAVYVDEVPLIYPVTTQGAALDLQRVEVLKGPQGTLYGQNATGGAINYIANKPTDKAEAGLTGTFGRFDRGLLEGYVSGPITDTLKARVAARAERGGDWQKSISRDDGIGRIRRYTGRVIVDWTPTDRLKATVNANGWLDKSDTIVPQLVEVYPNSNFNVDRNLVVTDGNPATCGTRADPPALPSCPINALTGRRVTSSRPDLQPVITQPGLIAPDNARLADWDPNQDFARNDRFWQASGRLDYRLSDQVTLTSLTSYAHMRRYQNAEDDGTAVSENLRNVQRATIRSFQQEVRLAADFNGIHWLVGVNYGHDDVNENVQQFLRNASAIQNFGGISTTGGGEINRQKIEDWGVFTNLDVPITRQLTLSGGLRLSEDNRRDQACGYPLIDRDGLGFLNFTNTLRGAAGLPPLPATAAAKAGQCYSIYTTGTASRAVQAQDPNHPATLVPTLVTQRLKQNNVPFNLNLNYKPTERSLVYLRYSRGYKAGNFSTLAGVDAATFLPVVQEQLTAYEIGARASFSRWLRVEGAVFQYNYVDKQVRSRIFIGPPFNNVNAQDTIPKSRLRGAEGTATVRPLAGLSLTGSATYIKSKVQRYNGFTVLQNTSSPIDLSGAPFNFTPKWSVNGDVNYTVPVTRRLDAFAGVNVAYRGRTSAAFVPPDLSATDRAALGAFDIDAYTLVDGQLGVQTHDGKWKLFAWGKNIFNKFYVTNVVRVSDVIIRFPGQPATYGVTGAMRF